jgi:hypothetical protein
MGPTSRARHGDLSRWSVRRLTSYRGWVGVGKHINNIFSQLDLALAADDNRRVLAVLTYLQG